MLNSVLLIGGLGPWEIVGIVVVILLLFGGKKIPELMKGLGKGVKEFKDAHEGQGDDKKASNEQSGKENQ